VVEQTECSKSFIRSNLSHGIFRTVEEVEEAAKHVEGALQEEEERATA
jgi:hypothetical protein